MSAGSDAPRNGPAKALWDADPETPIEEIPELLRDVYRWECTDCGNVTFTHPGRCRRCKSTDFERHGGGEA